MATTGAPSPTDIITIADKLGTWFKSGYAALGLGAPAETTTLEAQASAAALKVLGDGSTQYGIANALLQAQLQPGLAQIAARSRFDSFYAGLVRQLFSTLDGFILTNLPGPTQATAWKFSSATNNRPLDLFLTRLNANDPNTPATPAYTLTLTAATGGAIPPTTAGKEPRVAVTLVGSADYYESQPNPASTQTALTGKFDAYILAGLTGTVPAGITKLRVYRQLDNNAGSGDPFYWDQDIAVTPAAAWPAVTLTQPDQALRRDWSPPVWLQALLLPEEAALYALAAASASAKPGAAAGLMGFTASSFVSPYNVALNPLTGYLGTPGSLTAFLGIGNTPAAAELARYTFGTGFAAGAIAAANSYAQALQGSAGAAAGIQCRTMVALGVAAAITNVTYTYRNAANPTTNQAGTITGPLTLGTAVGNTISLVIPAGQIVSAITGATIAGPTSGSFIFEALPLRTI